MKRMIIVCGIALLSAVAAFAATSAPNWTPVTQPDLIVGYYTVKSASTQLALETAGSKLGVFSSGGECRGVAEVMQGPKGKLFQITIGVASSSERNFSFKIWDAGSGVTYDVNETIESVAGVETIGGIAVPATLTYSAGADDDSPNWTPVTQPDLIIGYYTVKSSDAQIVLEAAGSKLGVFSAGGECRGVAEIMQGPRGKLFQITIGVASSSERNFTFKIWDAESGVTYDVNEIIESVVGVETIGSIAAPAMLTYQTQDDGASSADDLNGDGRADIVMTINRKGHSANGSTGAWLIQQGQTAKWGDLSQRNVGWDILGLGATAFGKATKDVYLVSPDNVVGAWTTDGAGKVSGWKTIDSFDAATTVGGLGDFNGDGQSDLLLVNDNGAVGCYFTSGAKTGWNYFQSLGSEWQICGIGDLNGDGRDDLVLLHDEGFAGSWLTQADGTMEWADLDTLQPGFEIVGCGDFDGDGTDDVLLRKGNYYGAWLVTNGNARDWMGLGDLGDVTVEQIADFDGDGRDDLRIRTANGDLGAELVKGEDSLTWAYYGSVGAEWLTEPLGLK